VYNKKIKKIVEEGVGGGRAEGRGGGGGGEIGRERKKKIMRLS